MLTGWGDFDRTFAWMDEVRRRMDRGFDDYTPGGREEQFGWAGRGAWPRVNVYDVGGHLLVQAELPGLSEKEVNISVHQDVLTLSGERKVTAPQGFTPLRTERAPVKFSRSFSLPCKVDLGKTTASLKDGILSVTLTKAAEAQPRQIQIRAQG
jgi:HSP20 family protein